MNLLRRFGLLLWAGVLAACATTSGRPATVPVEPGDAHALVDTMEAHRVAHALGGRATVRLQGPHGNQSADVAFVADPAGRMRADITALFGFPLATLVVADEDFAFFEYGSNRYVMGRLDGEGLEAFSTMPLHPAELFALVTGVLPLDGYALEEGSFARRGESVFMSFRGEGERRLGVLVSPDGRRLREILYWPQNTRIRFLSYRETEVGPMPREVLVEQDAGARLEFRLGSWNFEPRIEADTFVLEPPPGAGIYRLGPAVPEGAEKQ